MVLSRGCLPAPAFTTGSCCLVHYTPRLPTFAACFCLPVLNRASGSAFWITLQQRVCQFFYYTLSPYTVRSSQHRGSCAHTIPTPKPPTSPPFCNAATLPPAFTAATAFCYCYTRWLQHTHRCLYRFHRIAAARVLCLPRALYHRHHCTAATARSGSPAALVRAPFARLLLPYGFTGYRHTMPTYLLGVHAFSSSTTLTPTTALPFPSCCWLGWTLIPCVRSLNMVLVSRLPFLRYRRGFARCVPTNIWHTWFSFLRAPSVYCPVVYTACSRFFDIRSYYHLLSARTLPQRMTTLHTFLFFLGLLFSFFIYIYTHYFIYFLLGSYSYTGTTFTFCGGLGSYIYHIYTIFLLYYKTLSSF